MAKVMSATDDSAIKAAVEARLRSMEKAVQDLEEAVAAQSEQLVQERHRLEVTREFHRLEFGQMTVEPEEGERSLFQMPKRFADCTIREACLELLRENGAMHVSEIQTAMRAGGRDVKRTSITSTLIRGQEFERHSKAANTFQLREMGGRI